MKGWSAKKAPAASLAAAPQPARAEPEEPIEAPAADAKAMVEWHKLRAKKGWTPETMNTVFYEFVKNGQLFTRLVEFARKWR